MIVQELYRAPWKPMPSGRTRLDSTGVWRLDYAKGNFAGSPLQPVAMGFADIPDADGNDTQGRAELVHFCGWAWNRPVWTWHAMLGDNSGYALMLGVGDKIAGEDWFIKAATGTASAPVVVGGNVDDATIQRVADAVVRKLMDTPNRDDHYGLPERLQSGRELQEWLTFPVLQAVKFALTDPQFLKTELVPALDAATAP